MGQLGLVILIIVGILIYFIPMFIANSRHVKNMDGIVLVTLFLGWTVLGWLIAVVWASSAETREEYNFKYGNKNAIDKQGNQNIDKVNITNIELTDDQFSALKIKESTIDDFDSIRILRNNSQPEFITAKTWSNLESRLKADDYIILGYYKEKKESSQVNSIELPNEFKTVTIRHINGKPETISLYQWHQIISTHGSENYIVLDYKV